MANENGQVGNLTPEVDPNLDPNANPPADKQDPENNPENNPNANPGDQQKTPEELAHEEALKELFGKPEAYEYTDLMPEGMKLNQEVTEKFNTVAEKLNLSQKATSELMALAVELTQQNQAIFKNAYAQANEAGRQQYEEALVNDKEIGGAKLDETIQTANLAYEKFLDADGQNLLKETGLNAHPSIVKMFHTLGKLIKDDSVFQEGSPSGGEQSREQILYPELSQA